MKQITRGQYYQLIGLRAVADHHEAQLKHIVRAAYSITGEWDTIGHTNDFVYGSRELDELLKLLEIEVVDVIPEAELTKP
jgi:hypothetical protein